MLKTPKNKRAFNHYQLHKTPTGIKGFDEITEGASEKQNHFIQWKYRHWKNPLGD
jgi:hypothetical protein